MGTMGRRVSSKSSMVQPANFSILQLPFMSATVNLSFYPAPAFGSYVRRSAVGQKDLCRKRCRPAVGQDREREAPTVHLNLRVEPQPVPIFRQEIYRAAGWDVVKLPSGHDVIVDLCEFAHTFGLLPLNLIRQPNKWVLERKRIASWERGAHARKAGPALKRSEAGARAAPADASRRALLTGLVFALPAWFALVQRSACCRGGPKRPKSRRNLGNPEMSDRTHSSRG
jgi:hypothetical protein